ncbi:hypothetical protein F350042L8_29300 [Fusobacterium ulcerans]
MYSKYKNVKYSYFNYRNSFYNRNNCNDSNKYNVIIIGETSYFSLLLLIKDYVMLDILKFIKK